MPSVDIFDLNNEVVGSLDLADEVFGAPVNEHLLYEAVRHSQAGKRAGSSARRTWRASPRLWTGPAPRACM